MSLEALTVVGLFLFGLPLLLWFLYPVLGGNSAGDPLVLPSPVEELLLERERAYTALADLDFDYECGKIDEEDYRRLREELIREAAEVLSRIDQQLRALGGEPTPRAQPTLPLDDTVLEAEIARFKKRRQQEG